MKPARITLYRQGQVARGVQGVPVHRTIHLASRTV